MYPGTTTKLTEATVAVAATINVKTDVVILTGTSPQIQTINPPGVISDRGITLVPVSGTVTLAITGNIAGGSNISMPINRAVTLYYSKTTRKWYAKI